MSRKVTATQECRASPVHWGRASPGHWSELSDSGSDEEDNTGQQPSPSADAFSANHASEDCIDADIHPRYSVESSVLKRRPLHQNIETTEKDSTGQSHLETEHTIVRNNLQLKFETEKKLKLIRKHNVKQERQSVFAGHVLTPVLITIGTLIFLYVIYVIYFERSTALNSDNLRSRVKDVLFKFKNIPLDAVVQFSAGIRSILESNPTAPAVFVVLYNDTGHGSYCVAKAIASLAMQYLGSAERNLLVLNPKELIKVENMTRDYGLILDKYKPLIEKHRSIIISDLQDLPGKMAMAFHFFCDIYDPIVQKALFIFTLQMRNDDGAKVIEQVESRMHNLWRNDILDDQRQALITRLTEGIIPLPSNILPSEKCPQ